MGFKRYSKVFADGRITWPSVEKRLFSIYRPTLLLIELNVSTVDIVVVVVVSTLSCFIVISENIPSVFANYFRLVFVMRKQ